MQLQQVILSNDAFSSNSFTGNLFELVANKTSLRILEAGC